MTAREPCPHGRRNCAACHAEADTQIARERWWSGEPGLLLPWYCRDEERAVYGMEPDGLWNGPTPCGATITGIPEADRAAMEARHRETCTYGCAGLTPWARSPEQFMVGGEPSSAAWLLTIPKSERGQALLQLRAVEALFGKGDAHLDGPASGYTAVDVTTAVLGIDLARERHRPEQYPTRGRWRSRKRVVRQLAADLGWPGCLEVTHDDNIVGAVLQAGVRLRDWRRFESSGRRSHERHRLLRIAKPLLRSAQRRRADSNDIPF